MRGYRGHGIALMRALMQQVTIEPGPAGTTVDMYARITPVPQRGDLPTER
jgi:hypothetical protein